MCNSENCAVLGKNMRSSEIETLDCDPNTARFGNLLSFKMYGVCGSERRSSFMMHAHRHVQDALRLFADKQRSETILYTNLLLVMSRLQLRHFKGSFFFRQYYNSYVHF